MYSTTAAVAQQSGNSWFNARHHQLTEHQAMGVRRPQSSLTNFRSHLTDVYDRDHCIQISDDDSDETIQASDDGSDDEIMIIGSQVVPKPPVRVDVNNTTFAATLVLEPGCDVELEDNSFLRVVEYILDSPMRPCVKGHRLILQNHPELLMLERRHEVVQLVRIDDNLDVVEGLETIAVESVVRNCKIVFTNQQYEYLNYSKDVQGYGCEDVQKPIFFCRYASADNNVGTDEGDPRGPPIRGRIEHLRAHQADNGVLITRDQQQIEFRIPDREVRRQWRGEANCLLGGSHVEFRDGIQKQKYTFGDAFCGAGGTSSGALSAKLKMEFALDLDASAIDTYRKNFEHTGTRVLQTGVSEFVGEASLAPDEWIVDILHLSPPCQPFCGANRTPNEEDNKKNLAALGKVVDLLKICRPRIVTLEEAKSLTDVDKRQHFRQLISYFIKKGYSVQWKAWDMSRFGVPQTRRRTIIIASGPGEKLPTSLRPTHGNEPGLRTPPTLGATLRSIPVHATHNDEIPRMKTQRQPYDPDDMLCRTILTAPKDHHFHPSGERRFSIREYAAIQTFPHGFEFEGPYAQKLKQIGNAVPPMFAGEMFRQLKSELRAADVAEARGYRGW